MGDPNNAATMGARGASPRATYESSHGPEAVGKPGQGGPAGRAEDATPATVLRAPDLGASVYLGTAARAPGQERALPAAPRMQCLIDRPPAPTGGQTVLSSRHGVLAKDI